MRRPRGCRWRSNQRLQPTRSALDFKRDAPMAQREETFATWAQPPGTTEAQRIENAIREVRRAMDDDARLALVTTVYVRGLPATV